MTTTTVTRLQQRRGTAAEWLAGDPNGDAIVLASGEIGLETDTNKFKIGNGSSIWTDLNYQSLSNLNVQEPLTIITSPTTKLTTLGLVTGSGGVQVYSSDLYGITQVAKPTLGTTQAGLLKRIVNTGGTTSWSLDTNTYLTSYTDTNYYPSAITFTAGTTAGPTLDLTMSGSGAPDITAVAIPSASETTSGIVTTAAQTFAGTKTFSSTISGSISGNAATATKLAATKTINTVAFDGSADIIVTAEAGTLTGDTIKSTVTKSSLTKLGLSTAGFVKTDASGNLTSDTITGYQPTTSATALTATNLWYLSASQSLNAGTYLVMATETINVAGTSGGTVGARIHTSTTSTFLNTLTASTAPASGSTTIAFSANTNLVAGNVITGPGIPVASPTVAPTFIVSVATNTATLSQALTTVGSTTANAYSIYASTTLASTQVTVSAVAQQVPLNMQSIITLPATATVYLGATSSQASSTVVSANNATLLSIIKIG